MDDHAYLTGKVIASVYIPGPEYTSTDSVIITFTDGSRLYIDADIYGKLELIPISADE